MDDKHMLFFFLYLVMIVFLFGITFTLTHGAKP